MIRLSLANRRLISSELRREWHQSTCIQLAPLTIRTRLLENGLRKCKAPKKPKMTERQRKASTAWAKENFSWSSENWDRVIFSDESTFTIQNQAGSNYVREDLMKPSVFSVYCLP